MELFIDRAFAAQGEKVEYIVVGLACCWMGERDGASIQGWRRGDSISDFTSE